MLVQIITAMWHLVKIPNYTLIERAFKQYWENRMPRYRKMKLDACLPPCTKINCNWFSDFSVKPVTLKLLEENVRTPCRM